jgi:hypothetical protein
MRSPAYRRTGRTCFTVTRDSVGGEWIDGEWYEAIKTNVQLLGNIQPSLNWNQMQTLDAGERTKQAIAIYCNGELYMASEGLTQPRKADIVHWDGYEWEVVRSMTYKMGVLDHCEAIAFRKDDV